VEVLQDVFNQPANPTEKPVFERRNVFSNEDAEMFAATSDAQRVAGHLHPRCSAKMAFLAFKMPPLKRPGKAYDVTIQRNHRIDEWMTSVHRGGCCGMALPHVRCQHNDL